MGESATARPPMNDETPAMSFSSDPPAGSWEEEFRRDPSAAFRRWFRLQEELKEAGAPEAIAARELAEDLWSYARDLSHASPGDAARFYNGMGAFFGSAGPASDLERSRRCFERALEENAATGNPDERARILHNFASALAGLGSGSEELSEAVAKFEEALAWRNSEREIARAVTLHNLGAALASLARADPGSARDHLTRSGEMFSAAVEIRSRLGLARGHALSLLQLGLVRKLGGVDGADGILEESARLLDASGLAAEAERAREAARLGR